HAGDTAYYKLGLTIDAEFWNGLPAELVARAVQAEGFALHSAFRALHQVHSRRRFRAAGELSQATAADANTLVLHHPLLKEGPPGVQHLLVAIEKIRRNTEAIRDAFVQRPSG
ncbi:MAG: hypothetical protein ABGZ17_12375, partial [Planctomycetaceae bacterium]